MRILIIGGGQDGIILSHLIAKNYYLDGLIVIRNRQKNVNYYLPVREIGSFLKNENYIKIENIINEFKPTHILNTVALSSTQECNKFKELALITNAEFVKKLANFVKNKKLKFIHLGSLLEKQHRPNCTYTISKILASKYIRETNNPNAIIFRLPNHESPLRDDRFFIREIIDLFQDNLENNKKISINIRDGKTKRYWSWAPALLQKILEMIIEDKYMDNFYELTTNLSLIEFTMCIADIFNLKEVKVVCNKSVTYFSDDFPTPKISENTRRWIKKIILVKNEETYNHY